jgi:outer membrane protein assembly factor BamB
VFAVNAERIYALDRANGKLQWEFALPNAPSATPVADEERMYLALGTGRLFVYALPSVGGGPAAPGSAASRAAEAEAAYTPSGYATTYGDYTARPYASAEPTGPQPRFLWEYAGTERLEQPPLLTPDYLNLVATDGTLVSTSKYSNRVFYSFQADAPVSAPLGQYGGISYMVAQDFNVYAVDIISGKVLWRSTSGGGPILRKPEVTDEDVYVSPERVGLSRLNRQTGEARWRFLHAERFLAENPKFVYAADRSNRMVILDRTRGTQLAIFEGARDFVVPVSNELTDRVYLAANDGLLVCLHDRDYATAHRNKTIGVQKPQGAGKEERKAAGETAPAAKEGEQAPPKEKDNDEGKPPAKEKDKGDETDKETNK